MTPTFDLLIPGEINPDLILSGDVEPQFGQAEKLVKSATLAVGSSSVITACGAARLGLKVVFIGKCGDDLFGHFMLEEMQKCGVNVDNAIQVPDGTTGLSVVLNRGVDRAILTYPGLIRALAEEEVPEDLLRQARHLHVASYFLQDALRPGLPRLFERARALGLTISLDTNYDPSEAWSGVLDLLPLTNIFLPNQAEACSLAREENLEKAAEKLSVWVETLAIKLGAQGALGVSKGQKVRAASIPVKVIDTVGAGDSFDAGFLYGYLNGWPLEKSLRLAVVCGALSTRAAGGAVAQASLPEALAHLQYYYSAK